jgi:hypothetical protein
MKCIAPQPHRLPAAVGSLREPVLTGIPVRPGMPTTETPALPRTEISIGTIALYLRKDAKEAPARRCRMIAGAAAGAAILPLSVLLASRGPPPGKPGTGTLLILSSGPFAHRLPPLWLRPRRPRQRPVRGSGITRPLAST